MGLEIQDPALLIDTERIVEVCFEEARHFATDRILLLETKMHSPADVLISYAHLQYSSATLGVHSPVHRPAESWCVWNDQIGLLQQA